MPLTRSSNHPDSSASRRAWIISFFVLAPLLVFGILAADIARRHTLRFDDPLLLRFHAHASPAYDAMMLAFSRFGGLPILGYALVLIGLFLWKKQRPRAMFLLSAMTGTCLLNIALKTAFQRTRPDLWLSIAPEHDFSFPSGHSMLSSTFVLATLSLLWHSRTSFALKGLATVVGVAFVAGVIASRLYLGVHFPSDVSAGFCLSLSWVALLTGIFQRRLRVPTVSTANR